MKNLLQKILARLRTMLHQQNADANLSEKSTQPIIIDSAIRSRLEQSIWLFDERWYLKSNPDIAALDMTPLEHYWSRGAFEGRNPSPVFDTKWYSRQVGFAYKTENALAHFIENAADSAFFLFSPCPIFDSKFYLRTYPDVESSGQNPFEHYMRSGIKEGRRPNDLFIPDWYSQNYPGIENPLVDHLTSNSVFSPLFDQDWYTREYEDALDWGLSPLAHYLNHGRDNQFSPNPYFDFGWYQKQYGEHLSDGEDVFAHFIQVGDAASYSPGPHFDSDWYKQRHTDIASTKVRPLTHFLSSGEREGREFSDWKINQGKISDLAIPSEMTQEALKISDMSQKTQTKIIAFYDLPVSSSDEQTTKQSLFDGHIYPRAKINESNPDLQMRFADDCKLAKQTGIDAFCVNIKNESDVAQIAKLSGEIADDFKVCLQFKSLDSAIALLSSFADVFAPIFKSPAYLTVDLSPLAFVDQTTGADDVNAIDSLETAVYDFCQHRPVVVAAFDAAQDCAENCDATLHDASRPKTMKSFVRLNARVNLMSQSPRVVGYSNLISNSLQTNEQSKPVIRSVVPFLDETETNGHVVIGSNPARYEFWLNSAISQSHHDTVCDTEIVCIKSWNNSQNNSFLEPDANRGFAWINATSRAIGQTSSVFYDLLALPNERRKFLFIGISAEQNESNLRWLNLIRRLKHSFGVDVAVMLLRGGPLLSEYEQLTSTVVASVDSVKRNAQLMQLINQGFKNTLCNTNATASIADELKNLGAQVETIFDGTEDSFEVSREFAFSLLKKFEPGLVKISVAVPNYNYSRYLRSRLDSIFNQTYPIFELIVLDDASTDDSVAVLNRIKAESGREFQLLVNEENSGSVFKQWHKSVSTATGDVIWLAEADDDASSNFLAMLAPRFDASPQTLIAFANSKQTDSDGETIADNYDAYYKAFDGLDFSKDFETDSKTFIAKGLAVRTAIANVSSALINRLSLLAVTTQLEPTLAQFKVNGDWRIYVELCKLGGKVAYFRSPMNVHRRHQKSVVHSTDAKLLLHELQQIHELISAEIDDPTVKTEQSEYREVIQRELLSATE